MESRFGLPEETETAHITKANIYQYEPGDGSGSCSCSSSKIPILQILTSRVIFEGSQQTQETEIVPSSPSSLSSSFGDFRPPDGRKKAGVPRCKTAPAMAVMRGLSQHQTQSQKPQFESNPIVRQAIFFLIIYLSLGVLFYSFNRDCFSGNETHALVDALYFCIVTMCTIGYGDIAPLTPATKLFACAFVLVGFGFIGILLNGMVNYVLDSQENMILAGIRAGSVAGAFSAKRYIFDLEKGRMRIRMKVGLALVVVVLCIGTGTMILYFLEDLGFVDSLYLSVMSVTTVGYGDRAFKTLPGRLFASLWLLFSTLAVARAFLYLAEARIDKRHRRITNWVLNRDITVVDLLAADVNNNGFISLCIGTGTMILYFLEDLGFVDSLYLSVMSVTTVGYGDRAFKTLPGRLFASLWLLFSTLAVARAFLYLAEARIDKRHRRITNWVLNRDITVVDLLAADVNNNGFISKSDYVVYKLKEMGKIGEKDILQICTQFRKLDRNNSGKITLPDLFERS